MKLKQNSSTKKKPKLIQKRKTETAKSLNDYSQKSSQDIQNYFTYTL